MRAPGWSLALRLGLCLALLAVCKPAESSAAQAANGTRPWIEQISWQPRAYLYHGMLSHEECDHVVALAEPRMARSSVVDSATGGSKVDSIRSSYGTFLRKAHDDVIAAIDERVAAFTHLPPSHAEDLQVLRYENGQEYKAHWDINDSPERVELMKQRGQRGGLRVATVLMYLSEVEEGGETAFPRGRWLDEGAQRESGLSDCGSKGVGVRPRKGDAVLFFSLHPGGQKMDKFSLHAGCPVLRGTKWSATKWIHVEPFGYVKTKQPAKCEDQDALCRDWAEAGECEANKVFMVGSDSAVGHCRLACKACVVCAPGDVLCERKNQQLS